MSPKEQMQMRMKEMGVTPKRSLGQNFLINAQQIENIVNKVASYMPAKIVEVGPGLGALTERFLHGSSGLVLVELDREFAKFWRSKDIELFEHDALKLDWESLKLPPNSLLMSNLPYQIAARLVVDRSQGPDNLNTMVLMFQKEVAQRITAQPKTKDYGFLSVVAQLAWSVNKLSDLGPGDFYPKPRVASRVLVFERQASVPPGLVKFVKKAFEQRRKMMLKAFPKEKDRILPVLEPLGYKESVRAEEVSPIHFRKIFEEVMVT